MQGTISVIIPVYNTGKYLKRCLESIRNQTYKNISVTIVDDGSTDNSGDICRSFSAIDNRFVYYRQCNKGVSAARNFGIEHSGGEYITFVDSDDWLDIDMYETMIHNLNREDVDIVICDAKEYCERQVSIDTIGIPVEGHIAKENLTPEILNGISGAVWKCIFKRSIVHERDRFPEGLPLTEDKIFCLKSMANARSIFYLRKAMYNRFMRNDSAVTSFRPDMDVIQIEAYKRIMEVIAERWTVDYERIANHYLVTNIIECLLSLCDSRNNFHFAQKYHSVRVFCENESIKTVLDIADCDQKYIIWMKQNNYFLITLYAWMKGNKRKY